MESVLPGYHAEKDAVQARLRRIEGQVRGLQRMVDDDTYCIDVLTQLAAVTKALQGVGVELLDQHLRHCVQHQHTDPTIDRVGEATAAIRRLLRT